LGLIYRQANRELGPVEPAVALQYDVACGGGIREATTEEIFRPELTMARKDRVSRRLLSVFKFWNTPPQRNFLEISFSDIHGNPLGASTIIEWKDVDNRLKDNTFPRLRQMELLPEMAAAFQRAGLDRTHPNDWYTLVALFSWAYFGDRRTTRGAPTKWDSAKYSKLIADFNEKKRSNPALSDEDVFGLLRRTAAYRTKRGPLSTSRLRKLLKEANDPTRNRLLKVFQLRDEATQL
jgi:hypothetical protein